MYTALIVDDEPIIRRGLRMMLPWEALGYTEVLEASDAEKALAIAADRRISLLITDICMPGIDGLDLTQRFHAMQPQISIIVITGYDRFEYAQRCCELGVRRLILKPIDETALTKVLEEETGRLRALESDESLMQERSRRKALSERLLREALLGRLARGEYAPDDKEDIARFLGMAPEETVYAAILSPQLPDNSEWSAHTDLLLISIESFLSQHLRERERGWCVRCEPMELRLFLRAQDVPEAMIEEINECLESELGITAHISASEAPAAISALDRAFSQAKAALTQPEQARGAAQSRLSVTSQRIVEQAKRHIETQYQEDLSVMALAEHFHISPNYFSRIYKQLVGMGCNEHLTQVRIQAAKALLAQTDLRCYEIAEAVGYRDTNYFSLAFKKNAGMSPEQYRIAQYEKERTAVMTQPVRP